MPTKKLYCYVDETGQDTKGRLFIVAIIVTADNRDELLVLCEEIESQTLKGKTKWGRAKHEKRLAYLRTVFADSRFQGLLRYSVFDKTTNYDQATIEAIARAVHWSKPKNYKVTVYVDGLVKSMRHAYSRGLHRLGISTRKVQGVTKEENNALTRLADSIAGFVRDVLEKKSREGKSLFDKARRKGVLVKV